MQTKENEQSRNLVIDEVKKNIIVNAFNAALKSSIILTSHPLAKVGITLATLALSKGADFVIENKKRRIIQQN